jgi:membrane fusion protein (multidrug efflux system)
MRRLKEMASSISHLEQRTALPPVLPKSRLRLPDKRLLGLLVAGIIATPAAYNGWQHYTSVVSTDDAFVSGHVHQLGARVQGTVLQIAVKDNQHVTAGQLLVKLDPRDFQLSLANAGAAVEKAKMEEREAVLTVNSNQKTVAANNLQADYMSKNTDAGVSRAQAALESARSGVITAQASIKQREAELERARADYSRYELLLKVGAVTRQDYDQTKESKTVAEANMLAANANLEQAKIRVSQAEDELTQAEASVVQAKSSHETAQASLAQMETAKNDILVQQAASKQAQAQYDNAMTQLSYTNIVAPVSGRVGHRTVELGQQVERGQALLSIVSDEKWVMANFKETDLHGMRPGQPVDVKVDAIPDKVFHGKVESISPASGAQFSLLPPDNASGNFTKVVQRIPVKIVFD